ncbi:DUF885 domain-containing protein [Rehaibacterium terrae]|jgi:uncharacterized protein (DUF885 family)|uniref:Uncharacterized protein (DUF885 family) n=1 Tax=Rehaibacterium terrae TaxID=1341696 RepID=A0A7W8DFC7_9GAMM|nr:DUF885 domain-containing protein [Rehaibacterium terrae]MBB5016308.1 uncharacterized protein (DUF885 family) [Rehaibacterium terrae]
MRKALKWSLRGLALVFVLAALLVVHTLWFKPLKIEWFFERVFVEYALKDPELLSSLRILPGWLDFHSGKLTDRSLAREAAMSRKLHADLATLRRYDRGRLDEQTRMSYDILEFFLANQVDGEPYRHHNYPLNQLFGVQNGIPTFLATQHPVDSRRDADNYLARLAAIPTAFDQVMDGLRLREDKGILPPRFVVEKVLAEMNGFVGAAPEENILYTSFAEKLAKLPAGTLDEAARERLLGEARRLIAERVYPAYQMFIDYYDGLLPRARGNNGVWELPDGAGFYAWSVRSNTTTDISADEVHELGLAEVARIEAEMDAILRGEGLEEGSIGERVQVIAKREDQLYPDSDAGRQQIIDDFQAIIDEADASLDEYFDVRPRIGVRVERVPEFREKTAPGAYYTTPAFDGSRPGIFYINLRSTDEIARFGMRTLAYHEAIPGHHFQLAIQQELTGVPTFRKILPFTAYAEGWALYAERVASEAGFHPTPLDELGRLQAEMFRAVRLVVDSGMHHKRWTREQAIDYMREKTGMPEGDVVAEIERYLVWPGQALAYKVGMNHILALREQAQAALGDKFDIRRFHNVVLTGGAMPLTLLSRRVEAWIAREQAGG